MFKTHNTNPEIVSKMSGGLRGYVGIHYAKLVQLLGESAKTDEYKTDAEWYIDFGNNLVASIYNYKNGKNYLGAEGLAKEDITTWHIGGESVEVVTLVGKLLNAPVETHYLSA